MGVQLLDNNFSRFSPHSDGHHSIAIGAAEYNIFTPKDAKCLMMQSCTSAKHIRYTLDGTAPTASKGFQLLSGNAPTVIEISENMIIRVFGEDATSTLQYCFGK